MGKHYLSDSGVFMRKNLSILFLLFCCLYASAKEMPQPPVAQKIPHEMTAHGDTRMDPYYWLRERENPQVKAYLEAENTYANAMMAYTKPLQDTLYKEMVGHIQETDLSVSYREGDYFYYSRTEQGKQYSIFCRKKGSLDAKEEIVMDFNELAKGLPYLGTGNYEVSDDGNLFAYAIDTSGYREFTVYVKNLRTGNLLPDKIEKVSYSLTWASDNKTLFYSTIDAAKRPYRIFSHVLGSPKDELVYEDKNEAYYVSAYRTRDKKYLLINSSATNTSECSYVPSDQPNNKAVVVLPREENHEYSVDHRDGLFYILTNKDAKNFRLVTAPVKSPQPQNWKEILPARKDVMLEGVDLFENYGVVTERENALDYLKVMDFRTGESHRIETADPVFSIYGSANPEYKTDNFRFTYESMVSPSTIYDYDMKTRKRTLLKQRVVPNYDSSLYTSDRFFATASDGAKVPVSIVYKKGVALDGSAPFLLEGYGSYGASYPVGFSSGRLVLLDRGMIYGIAHIRGGGDMGRDWYDQGKMLNKKNTFTDFISVAEYLVSKKYTSADRLVATGGSAGGLLMGAITNMRPDLFKAIVTYVPFVDVITTMSDPTIPLVVPEYTEWGNPSNKEQYVYMKSYSPYDNIAPKNYPAILVRTSFWDSQVPYWEPAKYVAKLRATKTDHNILLLKTEIEAGGHGGKSGRYDSLHEDAFDYAFILEQVGITK
jgi:oligopeptidase B